jgi:hypothetical protein
MCRSSSAGRQDYGNPLAAHSSVLPRPESRLREATFCDDCHMNQAGPGATKEKAGNLGPHPAIAPDLGPVPLDRGLSFSTWGTCRDRRGRTCCPVSWAGPLLLTHGQQASPPPRRKEKTAIAAVVQNLTWVCLGRPSTPCAVINRFAPISPLRR